MKKHIRQLVINITDICNMECDFCLRGDSRERKIDLSLIPKIFEGIEMVDCITITGGDPSCYVEAVTAIVDYLVEHQNEITVYGLFIVTNAKVYKQELVDAVKTMLFLLFEKEYGNINIQGPKDAKLYGQSIIEEMMYEFGIAVSMDEYHEPIDLMNFMKYRMSGVYSATKETDFTERGVIRRGRAEGFIHGHDRRYYEFSVAIDNDEIEAEEVYVTLEGKVFSDCDMSYDMEDEYEPAGDLHEETLGQIMQRYADELEKELEDSSN